MMEITFTYPTPEGSQSIDLERDRISFGRGSEADHRFADDGLSRLHAVVYRQADRVWVVDENSTNGTFVNGKRVPPGGTPLRNGDTIRIGHRTDLTVRIREIQTAAAANIPEASALAASNNAAASAANSFNFIPLAVIAAAVLIIGISAAIIGLTVFGGGRNVVIVQNSDDGYEDDEPEAKETKASATPKAEASPSSVATSEESGNSALPETTNTSISVAQPSGKKYLEMSDAERRQYLEIRAQKVAEVIGNRSSGSIPAAAIDKIKAFTEAYAKRANVKALGGCRFGDNLQATYERASKNAPFIVRAFNEKGIDARIGLYLAMIESEHCVCLQSPTGPLGMFQFTRATGELHGLKVKQGASPTNPDERCEPEPSARAAASYMKALTGRYGTGPSSVPLAIGSYNSGEGGLSSNLQKALDSNSGLPRDFWTLIANGEILSKQFQSENFKYVPKFFAAAIIGENPQDFGLTLQPISTYTK